MNLANNIKQLAKEHGITITQLANELGVLQPQISRTINNPRITVEDLSKIAGVLGCGVGDFFKDGDRAVPLLTCPHCGRELRVTLE